MPATSSLPQVVRFGSLALDLRSGELTKNGRRLLMSEQPFRILTLLVRQPGTLVTREDLCRALWTDNTFVDFEHSLNAAVRRLRAALGESATGARFIETLPRRGYRFIADVEECAPTTSPDDPVNAPYGLLAQHYDRLCDYAPAVNRHARSLILRTALPKVHRVCDLGCRSGESAGELARSGLEVHAVDLSPVFCETVRSKARKAGVTIHVHCQDMRDFALARPVDLVLAEFASLNNLADRRDLSRLLDSVAQALVAGGWFLCDVNTPQSLRMQYPPTCYVDEEPAFRLVQRGSVERDGQRARLDFDWFVPAGQSGRLWRHVRETLWHVSWTNREVMRALRLAGFDHVRCFDGIDVRPRVPDERRGTDMYYLGRKRPAVTLADGAVRALRAGRSSSVGCFASMTTTRRRHRADKRRRG
jgi:DNA-binding winged helix-turn-helix (wHTH) protein